MSLSLEKSVAAILAGLLVVFFALAILQYQSTRHMFGGAVEKEPEYGIQASLMEVYVAASDAEIAQGRYVITGEESFAELFSASREAMRRQLDTLHRQLSGAQLERLNELQNAIDRRIELAETLIVARRNGGLEAVRGRIAGGETKMLRDRIKSVFMEMTSAQAEILRRQEALARQAALQNLLLLIAGGVLALFSVFATAYFLRRSLMARVHAEHGFRTLIAGIQDYAIFRLDPKGNIVSWNAGAERIKGYSEAEAIGRHFTTFYPPDEQPDLHGEANLSLAELHGRHEEEGWRVRKDGTRFWARIVLTALRDIDGKLEGFAKVTRDESERRKADEDLSARQRALVGALKEREILLQEVHHRVKNNLQIVSSMINMHVRQLNEGAVKTALLECKARIMSIALVHEKLYQSRDFLSISLANYIRDLTRNIVEAASVTPGRITTHYEIDSTTLPVDIAIPCGLILNELIGNSLKHAFPDDRNGTITIRLKRERNRVRLAVADDGIGMPDRIHPATSESLGLTLVATFAEQLSGELKLTRASGTCVAIDFPIEDAA